jgi:hypothetical protein
MIIVQFQFQEGTPEAEAFKAYARSELLLIGPGRRGWKSIAGQRATLKFLQSQGLYTPPTT